MPPTLITATLPRMPSTTMTSSSSTSVIPSCRRRVCEIRLWSMPVPLSGSCAMVRTSVRLDLAVDAVHRRDLGDRYEADGCSDEDHDAGLEAVGELLQSVLELAGVEPGGAAELLVERAGALAHTDHL